MAESIANKVKSFIKTSAAYRNLSGNEIIKVNNLDGYPLSRAVELWQRKLSCRLLVIVPSEENARNLIDDLSDVRDIPVVYFPSSGKQLYSSYSASVQEAGQLKAIEKLESMNDGIIVTHVRAFASPVISRQSIRNFSIRLKSGDHFDSTGLASRLAAAGYYKASSCYEVGTFALRGEVIPPDSDDFVSNENLFRYQARIILELARTENCVIIGRCADYILKDDPNVVRIFIHAPMPDRIQTIMKRHNLSEEAARKEIARVDKRRANYYRTFTGSDWRDAGHYDLCLDSAALGSERCVELAAKFVKLRLEI